MHCSYYYNLDCSTKASYKLILNLTKVLKIFFFFFFTSYKINNNTLIFFIVYLSDWILQLDTTIGYYDTEYEAIRYCAPEYGVGAILARLGASP
jgi:hypothetical protein